MVFDRLVIKQVVFPGRAGSLQQHEDKVGLLAELGDNYATYHSFLSDQFDQIGGRLPQRWDYVEPNRFLDVMALAQDIVRAEALLRIAHAWRSSGRPPDAPLDLSVPLLDRDGALVSLP